MILQIEDREVLIDSAFAYNEGLKNILENLLF